MKVNGLGPQLAAAAALSTAVCLSLSVYAQAPFYQGKTITIVQGTEAGGSSDMMTKAMLHSL